MNAIADPQPVLPDYSGACVSNIVPTVVARPPGCPSWFPSVAHRAEQIVLLVLDGLGWNQLQDRLHLAPNLASMTGSMITTVCPTTTAAALTSISTGLPPGEHGIVGYRIRTDGTVLNSLRWQRDDEGDARRSVLPEMFQPHDPFLGSTPGVITKGEFARTGFSAAHLRGGVWAPWWSPSGIAAEVAIRLAAGDRLVYAYYDGIDKVGHLFGLGDHYDAELAVTDAVVGEVMARLTPGAVLLVTADHGQVHVGDAMVELPRDLEHSVTSMSGEARFRWLHVPPGATDDVAENATEAFGEVAWVVDREQVVDERWFGPVVSREAYERLGDVALVPHEPIGFRDANDTGSVQLIGRHGSLTSDEVHVPLLAAGLVD